MQSVGLVYKCVLWSDVYCGVKKVDLLSGMCDFKFDSGMY